MSGNSKSIKCICIFLLIICVVGCQPTPESSVVVFRGKGLPEGSIIDPVSLHDKKSINAPEIWKEHLILNQDSESDNEGKISLIADAVPLEIPDVSNIPVFELQQIPLSNEQLQDFVSYFSKGLDLLERTSSNLTKDELDILIYNMENKINYYRDFHPEDVLNRAKEVRETAPESVEYSPVNSVEFSMPKYYDEIHYYIWNGQKPNEIKKTTKPNYFGASFKENGLVKSISAKQFDADENIVNTLTFGCGSRVFSESMKKTNEELLLWYESSGQLVEAKEQESFIDSLETYQDVLESNVFSLAEAKGKLELALNDLFIKHLTIKDVEKVVWSPLEGEKSKNNIINDIELKPGYLFKLTQSLGGLNTFSYSNISGSRNLPELSYSPIFFPETLEVLITEDGICQFIWENITTPVRTIAENIKLLPFSEIKEKFADHLFYRMVAFWGEVGFPPFMTEFKVNSVKLCATYITAFEQPLHVWLVPVWVFEWNEYTYSNAEPSISFTEYSMFNAIDGGFIYPWDSSTIGIKNLDD